MIFDQTQDVSGTDTHIIFSLVDVPDFVKQASDVQLRGADNLREHMYGDRIHRRFPMHTPAATWLSSAFLTSKKAEYEPAYYQRVKAALDASVRYWGISQAVHDMQTAFNKQADNDLSNLPDDAFACVWTYDDGSKERNFPLRHAAEVKEASEWFRRYAYDFEYQDRQRVATRILEKAAAFNAPLDNDTRDYVAKAAGHGTTPAVEVADALRARAWRFRQINDELAGEFRKIADVVVADPSVLTPDARHELAHYMDRYDRQVGLVREYGRGFDSPEDVLFGITTKVAADCLRDHVQTATGAIYEKAALQKITAAQFEEWMPPSYVDQVCPTGLFVDFEKLASSLTAMSREDAQCFDQLTKVVGIPAVAHDAATASGMSLTERQALAAAYPV